MKFSIFTVLWVVYFAAGVIQHKDYEDEFNQKMVYLARSVVESYMNTRRRCVVIISDKGLLDDFDGINDLTILRVNFNGSATECDPYMHKLILNAFYEKCTRYIVQISRPKCFFPAWFLARNGSTYEKHNPRVLFLPVKPHATVYGEEILAMNQTNISHDILIAETSPITYQEDVIYPSGTDKPDPSNWPVTLYTNNFWQYVGEPGRIGRIYIDEWSWELGFKRNVDLYPDKVRDLRGKVLRLSAFPYLPYGNNEPMDGSEARILIEFCNVYNCTVVDVDDGHLWGSIYPNNGTGVGEAGTIYMELSDFGVGANYLWLEFWPFLEFSNCYLYGALTVMVPKTELLSGLLTPFMPFPPSLWFVIVLCVIVSSLGLQLVTLATYKYAPHFADMIHKNHKFITFTDSLVRGIGMLVLQQPQRLVYGSPVRHLFTAFEFIYLVVTSAYAAELYDFLTIPRTTKPIDSVFDLAESNIIWMTDHEVWVFGIMHAEDPSIRKAASNFRAYPTPELIKLGESDKPYGLGIERMAGGHYTELPYITDKFVAKSRVMRDNYYWSPLVVNMQKGSPYANRLNDIISRMVNGGLYYAWEADCVRKYLNYTKQLDMQWSTRPVKHPPKVISVSAIEGAFLLYVIGVGLAIGVFFLELYVRNVMKVERCFLNPTPKWFDEYLVTHEH
ncbi:Ligand-gated ion channel [Nesidiocoris tenuis]|uniref:Ligand-gated ion channel n=1 Tax=Nesidiocoris tenuis TaxID=355587 RepID=A0ABN7A736_9HEMI|nr:Ligand-gated ion channel [Nesidiocoris tenuis]